MSKYYSLYPSVTKSQNRSIILTLKTSTVKFFSVKDLHTFFKKTKIPHLSIIGKFCKKNRLPTVQKA